MQFQTGIGPEIYRSRQGGYKSLNSYWCSDIQISASCLIYCTTVLFENLIMTTTFYFENSQGVILDEQGNKATGQEAVSAN
jgi:hypothetical protein